jgi:hypothetical protein
MATPAERKALLFFGVVALLGAGVRLWQPRQPSPQDTYSSEPGSPRSPRQGKTSGSRGTTVRKAATSSRTRQIIRDSTSVVDLDRATMSEIDALGVLPGGVSRLIVADRDSFGPFGSLNELRRVPFLSASTLRKLAPRVTFSRVPRPSNTVVHPRTLKVGTPTRRKAKGQP